MYVTCVFYRFHIVQHGQKTQLFMRCMPQSQQKPGLVRWTLGAGSPPSGGCQVQSPAIFWWIPSGKHTTNHGKSPFFMGKLTISMAIFNSKLLNYQRVSALSLQLCTANSFFSESKVLQVQSIWLVVSAFCTFFWWPTWSWSVSSKCFIIMARTIY